MYKLETVRVLLHADTVYFSYSWSTKQKIFIIVQSNVRQSALNTIKRFVAGEGVLGPGRERRDWFESLHKEREKKTMDKLQQCI